MIVEHERGRVERKTVTKTLLFEPYVICFRTFFTVVIFNSVIAKNMSDYVYKREWCSIRLESKEILIKV